MDATDISIAYHISAMLGLFALLVFIFRKHL
jgi:hypothetical protein